VSATAAASTQIESCEPGFPEFRGGAELDLVRLRADGEGQDEIRRWKPPSSLLRPLDEPESPGSREVAESQRLELGRIAESVEIDVQSGETRELVDV
jgi:hypothetical protein